ncbi:hypothetical protein QWZ08_00565 [Ferruginibacter paludis]|uniref:DUF6580 family putative transport protein n=1 Tax=Ferruginibacter paludis TaxID=1310417 RepID=UPI0025B3FA91|nr:DUF6580 family putative transport protein [Ferruginibacter paludis]MDN3654094.1 hypothetical protein [Ferruginibacter paludis]
MTTEKINPRFAVLAIFMLAVAAMRIPNAAQLTPWANFTPIGAMGLFGGTYFTKQWKAILFPLLTLFASDLIIQAFIFNGKYGIMYSGWYWIYGIFIFITFIGKWLIKKVTLKNVLHAAVTASLTHWLLSDFTVWAGGGTDLRTMQPLSRDWAGLQQCYIQGFPFMRNFLAGTLVYSGIMFGAFEWMKVKNTSLQLNAA